MSLEVDRRGDAPEPYTKQEDYKYSIQAADQQAYHATSVSGQPQKSRQVCGLRPATLVLSIALAVMTVLAVIAAGVGGSLAAKNKYMFIAAASAYVKLTIVS